MDGWKCRARHTSLPGHPRESRGLAQLYLGARRRVYSPLNPTTWPGSHHVSLEDVCCLGVPAQGLDTGWKRGSVVCSPPASQLLLGAAFLPWAAPTLHVDSGEVGHPSPPPVPCPRNAAWVQTSQDGAPSVDTAPADGAPVGSPLLGFHVLEETTRRTLHASPQHMTGAEGKE